MIALRCSGSLSQSRSLHFSILSDAHDTSDDVILDKVLAFLAFARHPALFSRKKWLGEKVDIYI